ncbi:MAG: phosphoribosyl-AMP cyclohydrolase [Desulfovibrionaceae bacterium]|nr:phosphoribosyl-AMP cyclohydrolase [Desulfovibrionaceae bacterium]
MSNLEFHPDFSKSGGLIAAIAQDAVTREVLMLAWMNEEAFEKTKETGEAWYFSRSRQKLWHKGESSGNTQKIVEMRLDCDGDAILLLIEQRGGAACHEGYVSCFSRKLEQDGSAVRCCSQIFDPKEVYRD